MMRTMMETMMTAMFQQFQVQLNGMINNSQQQQHQTLMDSKIKKEFLRVLSWNTTSRVKYKPVLQQTLEELEVSRCQTSEQTKQTDSTTEAAV